MRVVWITHNYPRFGGDPPGAFLHALAVALRARDVDVRVVAPSDAGEQGGSELDGVPIRRVRYGAAEAERLGYGGMDGAVRSLGGIVSLAKLRAALRDGARQELRGPGPALVHAHWWIPAGLAVPAGAPFVLTCHGTDIRILDRVMPLRAVARPIFRRAKVVTTVSRVLAAAVKRLVGVSVAADAIQPMPVATIERPVSDGTGGMVVIGRLTAQKRVDLALEAFAIARRRGVAGTLTIVGDGPVRGALERRASADDLRGAVVFAGTVSPGQVPGFLAHASVAVMPARDEGFGLVAAEALMQGVPVIACSDGGGLDDIVPATGAGRVVAADPAALAAAMIDITRDAGARAAARTEGAGWRERLAPGFVAERCIAWYRRALDA